MKSLVKMSEIPDTSYKVDIPPKKIRFFIFSKLDSIHHHTLPSEKLRKIAHLKGKIWKISNKIKKNFRKKFPEIFAVYVKSSTFYSFNIK